MLSHRRREVTQHPPATPWFFFAGLGVLSGHAIGMDLSGKSWPVRVIVNFVYLAVTLAIALVVRSHLL